jgi:hypothetical protein
MLLRRIVALLTMLASFHLTVATGDASCAPHADDARAAAGTEMTPAHAGHAMSEPAASPGAASLDDGGVAPCETATGAPCCDAAVPCVDHGLASATRAVSATAPAPAARIGAAAGDAPPSYATPPEPPPPKA